MNITTNLQATKIKFKFFILQILQVQHHIKVLMHTDSKSM